MELFYQELYQALRVQWLEDMQQEDSLKQCRKKSTASPVKPGTNTGGTET